MFPVSKASGARGSHRFGEGGSAPKGGRHIYIYIYTHK